MKVILTDEIRGLGGRGEVVVVKDGYARNYLIPKKFAREATPGNLKAAEHEKKKWALLTIQEVDSAKTLAKDLDNMTIVIHKRAGAEGTLFGSVTTGEIAEALAAKGFEMDKRRIETHQPIKTLGEHEVDVHLHREVTAKLKVDVHALGEGGVVQPVKAAPAAPAAPEATEEAAPVVTEEAAPEAEVAEPQAETEQEQ
jgi:large subunit ribosomal protein L9